MQYRLLVSCITTAHEADQLRRPTFVLRWTAGLSPRRTGATAAYRMIIERVDHVGQRTSIGMPSISAWSPPRPTDADGDQSQDARTRLPAASRKWLWTTTFRPAGALHGCGRAFPGVSMDAAEEASMQLSNPVWPCLSKQGTAPPRFKTPCSWHLRANT